jgi:hypothetical protein
MYQSSHKGYKYVQYDTVTLSLSITVQTPNNTIMSGHSGFGDYNDPVPIGEIRKNRISLDILQVVM